MHAAPPLLDLLSLLGRRLSRLATEDDLTALECTMDIGFEHAAKERAAGRVMADNRHERMMAAEVMIAVEIAAIEGQRVRVPITALVRGHPK